MKVTDSIIILVIFLPSVEQGATETFLLFQPTDFKTHPCIFCNIKFTSKKDFLNHMRKIHGKHLCDEDECDKEFFRRSSLYCHKKTSHTPSHLIKTYECKFENCNFTHKTLAGLRYHSLSHTEKSHICNVCQKAFFTLSCLKQHLLTHTGKCG